MSEGESDMALRDRVSQRSAAEPGARGLGPVVGRWVLPLRVSSAAKARAVVREFLVGAGPGVDLDGAVLVVSELVSNAVRHASGSPADLKLEIAVMPGCMRIEVADPDPRPPVVYAGGPHDECGRGLRIVDRLARCWGWEPVGGSGKRIWCELAEPPWSARRG